LKSEKSSYSSVHTDSRSSSIDIDEIQKKEL